MPIKPIKPIKPNMPNMPIAHYAYYAQYAHPPKNTNGGDTPRAGAKRVQPPFTPMRDASPPFMLDERLYSSLQLSLP